MADNNVTMRFPVAGMDRLRGFSDQRRQTTPEGVNVRAFDTETERARGSSRPGLSRFIHAAAGTLYVSGMEVVSVSSSDALLGGNAVQTNEAGRLVTLVVVDNGTIKRANVGDTSWTTPTGGSSALVATGRVFGASYAGVLYLVDGTNYKKYTQSTDTVATWAASAGTLPTTSAHTARLICNYRNRIVLAGIVTDATTIYATAQGNPLDIDYGAVTVTATMAFSLDVGVPVTCIATLSNDVMFIGTDAGIWVLRGDPMNGGTMDLVSAQVGCAFGRPCVQGPDGTFYFMSSKLGVYAMSVTGQLQRISDPIGPLLAAVDVGAYAISMAWSDRYQGFHLFLTPNDAAAASDHYFFEQRTGAWWIDRFANVNHSPWCTAVLDGNGPTDRVTLMGSWDGYVRVLDPDATRDDYTDIASSVWIGPLLSQDMAQVMVREVQAVLGENSGDVTVGVYIGRTAEEALGSDPVATMTMNGSRNYTFPVRRAAYAVYLKFSSTSRWNMEMVRLLIGKRAGAPRIRGR